MKFFSLVPASFFASVALAQGETAPVQAAPAGQPPAAPGWVNLALIGGMVLFMWLFIIRPQAKRQKEHRKFVDALKVGQEVVTQAGIVGKIVNVSEAFITLDAGNGNMRILKSSVVSELGKSEAK
jgi:preprotein translocase subunit YajC